MSLDDGNPYQSPNSSVDLKGAEGVPPLCIQYIYALFAFPVLHLSSVFLPLSLWNSAMVLNMITLGKVSVYPNDMLDVLLLLFFIAAMGVTITFVFCALAGVIWDAVLAIVFWVVFGSRAKEFFSKSMQVIK